MDGLEHVGVSRRAFVAAAGSAVSLSGPWSLAAGAEPPRKIPVGVQLWTLRRELADDMPGTLRQVSKIGYEGVELWFQKWPDPRELKNVLDDCGLKIASAHVNLKDMLEDFPRLRDYHQAIGNTTLVIPYIPDFAKLTPEGWRKTVDDVRLAARAGREEGFTVLYHNHDFEFTTRVDGVEVFDLIFGTIEEKLLGAEIDVFFVADVFAVDDDAVFDADAAKADVHGLAHLIEQTLRAVDLVHRPKHIAAVDMNGAVDSSVEPPI